MTVTLDNLPEPSTATPTVACVPDIDWIVATELPPVYTRERMLNDCVPVPELVMVIAVPTSAS